jgi:hypothetical protein
MISRYFRFLLPIGFFGLAIFAWGQLGNVAVSDIGAGVGNHLRQFFGGLESPTHPILEGALLCITVVSFIIGLFLVWRLPRSVKHEDRA